MKENIRKSIEDSIYGMVIDDCVDSSSRVFFGGRYVYLNTIQGRVRTNNQDRLIVANIESQYCTGSSLFVVALADGMGGMVDGARAASITISSFIAQVATANEQGLKKAVFSAANYANFKVYEAYGEKGGATLSAIVFGMNGSAAVNVGDSRIYHVDSLKKIRQLSVDDTISGQVEDEDFSCWENPTGGDNRLVQYIGMGEGLNTHIINLPSAIASRPDGYYVLSSDGLHYMGKQMMEKIIENSPNEANVSERLIDVSDYLSGHDNSSLILVPDDVNPDAIAVNKNIMKLSAHGVGNNINFIIEKNFSSRSIDRKINDFSSNLNIENEAKYDVVEESALKNEAEEKDNIPNKKTRKNKKSKKAKNKKDEAGNLELEFILEEGEESGYSK